MKIITALNNPIINNKIKEKTDFEIICNDIQYQDGIIELLEKNDKIDLIVISELLPGELDFTEIINKIKLINNKIEIIAILKEKNEKIKNQLISKGIFNIFINNEITIEELIKIIEEKNNIKKEIEINEEIENLKKMILDNKKTKKENKIKKIINKFILEIKNKKNNIKGAENKILEKSKIISVAGTRGIGKTVFSSIITKLIKNKKIILVDFDVFNESLNTTFGKNKYPSKNSKKEKDIFNLIIKLNKNIDLLFATDILFNDNLKIEKNKIKKILEKLEEKYELIIIDTSSECFFDYTKEILEKSDLIIFLTEANLIELKKSKKLLEIYINKWKIEKQKINIVFNKQNINSIDSNILKVLFSDFNILGTLKINNNYNLLINSNLKNINKKIKKEFFNIINKLNLGGSKSEYYFK